MANRVFSVESDGSVILPGGTVVRPNGDVEIPPGKGLIMTDTNGGGNVYKIVVTDGDIDLQQQ
jgi:hypothetical protein